MKELTSTTSSSATILDHLKNALIEQIDLGVSSFKIDLDLDLNDPKMASFYIFGDKPKNEKVLPEIGTKVRTHADVCDAVKMQTAKEFLVEQECLDARRPNAVGKFKGWVAGCGGDVWWIEHEDCSIAAYSFDELEFEK